MVKITKQLYTTNRQDWRAWLKKNHATEKEIWLTYYKKHTGRLRIPYDHAVEEALCFGWIDSTVKRVDDEKYIQKFTPRKKKSIWSEANKKRAQRMVKQGRMTAAGFEKISTAKRNGRWEDSSLIYDPSRTPPELKAALASNKKAFEFYQSLAPTYKKQYHWWIVSAKREETINKRIKETVRLLAKGKKLGMQ